MNKKQKIIIVHFQFSPYGGGEIAAYNNYRILKKNAHDVYFFAIDKKPYFEDDYQYADYFVKPRRKNNFLDYHRNIPSAYFNTDYAGHFGIMLDEIKPDIVHIHSLGQLTYSVLQPCFDRNIPVVKTEHSALSACPSESLFYQNRTLCTKELCVKGNYLHCILNKCCKNSLYSSFVCSLKNYINDLTGYNNKISKFISPSSALKRILVKKGIPENKIKVIYNFFDDKFKNTDYSGNKSGYFLYSGRLYNFKGLRTLIEAMKELPREIPLHIAGTGPMEDELKKFCIDNQLDNVNFLGFLPQNKLAEEYKNCRALIVPSVWFEIFGLITIEAMAYAKPVIGSNIGALPEIIEHNKTGLLFKAENTQQLKECMLKYWNNPNLALKHGEEGYRKANRLYTEDIYYNNLINLYMEVLNEK